LIEHVGKRTPQAQAEPVGAISSDDSGSCHPGEAHLSSVEDRLQSAETARKLGDALFEIQRHLGTAPDAEEVVGLALGLACEALKASSGSIDRRELGGWVTSHVWGPSLAQAGVFHGDDASPVLIEVKRTGQAVVVRDTHARRADARLRSGTDGDPEMTLPLTSRGRVVGALSFTFGRPGSTFGAEAIEFGSRLAMLLSMAQETQAQLNRHRRVAEAFQRALIDAPLALEGVDLGHIYAPASDADFAGGDFYDVFPLEDGRIAFSIGDVSGRGLNGATTTALVRDCIRVATLDGLSPAAVLSKTNRMLLIFGAPEMFATVFFGILDARTGAVTYAAGGCPAPVLMNRERRVGSAGDVDPLLGVLPDMHFETRQLALAPGEWLVCFTNGLPEARSGDGFLEAAGVETILRGSGREDARGLAQELYEAALGFTGGILHDDVAILIIGICDPASEPAAAAALSD
jgi:serine phosphatase RsbU (regulator of sigma subunit)